MYIVTSLRFGRTWFGSHNFPTELSLVQSVLSCCQALPRIQYVPEVLSAENYPSEVEDNSMYPSSAAAENEWRCVSLLHSNEIRYLLYRSTETIWPAQFPGCNSRRLFLSSYID